MLKFFSRREMLTMIDHNVVKGLSRVYSKEIMASDAGSLMGRDMLDFLISTPTIIHMIIESSCELLDHLLPKGYVTVGRYLEISHERPTLVGEKISLLLKVENVDEDKIFLEFEVSDSHNIICKGKYLRLIVNKEKLVETAYSRSTQTLKK